VVPRERRISGRAHLDLRAGAGGRGGIRLLLADDLRVKRVTDGSGRRLPFVQSASEVAVALAAPSRAGQSLALEVSYAGTAPATAASAGFAIGTTGRWYPRVGDLDRATYDVTLRFPAALGVIASGWNSEGGQDPDGLRWIRNRVDEPTAEFSFELGEFLIREDRVGDVDVTVAFDERSRALPADVRENVIATIHEALAYFQVVFGAYPLDTLKVAIAAREHTRSAPGFVSLSDRSVSDPGWPWVLLMPDRSSVIAHEIAHQWWGGTVGWKSYRDEWLGETLASYSAELFARSRSADPQQAFRGIFPGWRGALMAELDDGRAIESVGPVALGGRLESSRYGPAYSAIVYLKGTLILETLTRVFPDGQFVEILGKVVAAAANRDISAEDLLMALERLSGLELDWFRWFYVYGVGYPQVEYAYSLVPREEGGWTVKGEARQSPAYRVHYRVARTATGRLDVARDHVGPVHVEDFHLVVPFQVLVEEDPDLEPEESREIQKRRQLGSRTELYGSVTLRGASSTFEVNTQDKPVRFWLDRKGEVLADFYSAGREPKQVLLYRGLDLAAAGAWDEAEAVLQRGLTASARRDADRPASARDREGRGRSLNTRIRLHLARLYLDRGMFEPAQAEFDIAWSQIDEVDRWRHDPFVENLQSRLEIHRGDYDGAFRRLQETFLDSARTHTTEGLVLLAIAARETGHPDVARRAAEMAGRLGADLSLLR